MLSIIVRTIVSQKIPNFVTAFRGLITFVVTYYSTLPYKTYTNSKLGGGYDGPVAYSTHYT
jgi:hypothetical protein